MASLLCTIFILSLNIMVYISKIREKLGERSGTSYIRTIRGLGYKLLP